MKEKQKIGLTLIIAVLTVFSASTIAVGDIIIQEQEESYEDLSILGSSPVMISLIRWDAWITPRAGSSLQFGAAANDADSDALTFHWDFGDGITYTCTEGRRADGIFRNDPYKTYAKTGSYTITCKVTDPEGNPSNTMSINLRVHIKVKSINGLPYNFLARFPLLKQLLSMIL